MCIRLNNAGEYCVITLKIMVMLQKVLRRLRTVFGRREAPSAPYVRYLVKIVKETDILIDKPKREELKTVRTPENIAAVAESVVKRHQHQFTVVLNN